MPVIHVNFRLGTVPPRPSAQPCRQECDPADAPADSHALTRVLRSPRKATSPAVDVESRKAAQRKDMLAKIHIAKGQCLKSLPGYTEDIYRATLEDMFDVQSAADLNPEQMHGLLLHFSRLGWQKKARKGAGRAPNAYASDTSGQSREALLQKIEAMLTEKGKAEGTAVPWAYAVGILKQQSGGITKSLDQATREQLANIIAALWRDAKRRGRRTR